MTTTLLTPVTRRRGARVAWLAYAALATALALFGIAHWLVALVIRGPVLYGEGAVAHAAILARDGLEYTTGASYGDTAPIFTAANYPPLYFHLAAIGDDPFVTGRLVSIVATLFVAAAIAWRARPAGRLVAASLAIAWLASVPVIQWGPAVKPDLVALAFTVGAVMALDRERPRHALAGALLGYAAMAKPTALLPAIAMFVFVWRADRRAALRSLGAGLIGAIAVALVTHGPDDAARVHVIDWNALPWHFDLAVSLALLGLVLLAVPLLTIAVTRPSRTIVTAYAVGATGIVILGGREGATINYLLDLSAAVALAVAGRAPLLATAWRYPIAAIAQAALAVLLLSPFGMIPGRTVTTGAWGEGSRIAAVRAIRGTLLVEDSGLLVATGREPLVDDVFLWSRNRAREVAGGFSFAEGERLLNAVRATKFDAVISEADLTSLDEVGGFERQRWHPDLVNAILDRYRLDRGLSGGGGSILFVYVPRGR
ncbi:MAG TPA: hypothetical protein VJQ09_00840 [Candidatus Limnocylindria bacterium]|nr:hypothetical protein [Candidatus Limnocylindria bacterium]